jgi:hypothetical protein
VPSAAEANSWVSSGYTPGAVRDLIEAGPEFFNR